MMEQQEWFCIPVKLSKKNSNSIKEISLEIIEQSGGKKPDATEMMTPDICGLKISECILSSDKRKILLLLDEAEWINDDLAKDIFDDLVPSIVKSFSDIDFRMIVSGRYLSRWEKLEVKIPLKSIQLTPFDFHVVCKTIEKLDLKSKYRSDYKQEFASHLMHLTGGHPGCIAQIIRKDILLSIKINELNEGEYFDKIVKPVIDEIRFHIPNDLKMIFERISVIRRFTPQLLRRFIKKNLIDWKKSEYDLEDRLLQTYLVNNEEGFLKDDITRRLLSIYLRKTDFEHFKKICKGAIEFYKFKLTDLKTHRADLIALELSFQKLQDIYYVQQGTDSDFFKTLPEIFDMLVKDREAIAKMKTFRDNINRDWEFQFCLNYFFRKDTYNDEPFRKMIKQIDHYINQLKEKK